MSNKPKEAPTMSNLVKRHRAAADLFWQQRGNVAAAQCKFHNDTADEIERLTALLKEGRNRIGTLLAKGGFSEVCTEKASLEWMHKATEALRDE